LNAYIKGKKKVILLFKLLGFCAQIVVQPTKSWKLLDRTP